MIYCSLFRIRILACYWQYHENNYRLISIGQKFYIGAVQVIINVSKSHKHIPSAHVFCCCWFERTDLDLFQSFGFVWFCWMNFYFTASSLIIGTSFYLFSLIHTYNRFYYFTLEWSCEGEGRLVPSGAMYHKSNSSYLRHGPLPHLMLGVVSKVSLDTGNRGQYWSAVELISHATHTHVHTHTCLIDQHSWNSYPLDHTAGHQLSITGWDLTLCFLKHFSLRDKWGCHLDFTDQKYVYFSFI